MNFNLINILKRFDRTGTDDNTIIAMMMVISHCAEDIKRSRNNQTATASEARIAFSSIENNAKALKRAIENVNKHKQLALNPMEKSESDLSKNSLMFYKEKSLNTLLDELITTMLERKKNINFFRTEKKVDSNAINEFRKAIIAVFRTLSGEEPSYCTGNLSFLEFIKDIANTTNIGIGNDNNNYGIRSFINMANEISDCRFSDINTTIFYKVVSGKLCAIQ